MALEVGVDVLSSFLSVAFDTMATSEYKNFFGRRKFSHDLIKELKATMIAISLILDDAEEKQFADEDVRKWLVELKDATYEAEDVLDGIQIEYQAYQSKAVKEDQESSSSSQDPLTEDLEPKLREILERLEDLMQKSAAFGLSKAVGENRPPPASSIDEFQGFYGLDAVKKARIDMPISDDDNGSNPGVIPIVGMGESTLAKPVYNDKAVAASEEQSKIGTWLCKSDQFDETKVTKEIVEKMETTSLADELEGFFGRDADKKAIIDVLISEDDNGSNPGVIPIVGMGGIGKTTLAQHVFNDKEVAKQFNLRGWICVSVEFTVLRLTKLILEEVTGRASDYDNLKQLQRNLTDALDGKKFLLVLDDVWNEECEKWRQLLTPLRSGAKGSRLIITTRSREVASKVQTVLSRDLRELEDKDRWKLFARHACLDVNSTANRPELQEIGKEIVRKCGGLPLAAKVIGGVLRWETRVRKWMEVLNSEIWDVQNADILPALAMSYSHLPAHLKRCFAYCAIFPQDYEFQREELVALWMPEGFLAQQKDNQSLEEVGDMYFDDLVSRSFFQHSINSRGEQCFVMHDLVHDLARFVSGEFCSKLEGGTSWKISKRIRYLSYERTEEDDPTKFQRIHETPFLHSFVLTKQLQVDCNHWKPETCIDKKVIDVLLPTRKLLRTLSLSCYGIGELPNSIGNLKHMRSLDLSDTSIRLLPEAVTALFNLEILILLGCRELVELPADMARLINLCKLDLRGTNLQRMPPAMGKLKKLSKLSDFVVGENGGSNIKELENLRYLRGEISIRGLQNVKDERDASEAILQEKKNLKVLKLSWNGDADDSRQVKQVLDRLQPHTHIELVEIISYGGREFSSWVGDISLQNLKKMRLCGFKNCIWLPPLGQLPSLEELSINGSYDGVLEAIGQEFYGMCKPGQKPFPSLKKLVFHNMPTWREWSSCNGAFPVLEDLELSGCLKLMSVPSHLLSLKRLRIRYCPKVERISVDTFPNLKELDTGNCSNLESLWSAAATTVATTRSYPLYSLSLTSLSIRRCSKLVSFPGGGLYAPNLKSMIIQECDNLKSLPQGMHCLLPSLEELVISDCPEMESLPEEGLPSSLSSLDIHYCPLKCISLGTLPNLKELGIWNCSKLELLGSTAAAATTTTTRTSDPLFSHSLTSSSFWESSKLVSSSRGGLHAPNLKSLIIKECGNLKSLPQGMHCFLPSLEELEFRNCPELMSVPSDLPSLKRLRISGCGELDFETLLNSACATLETIRISGSRKVKCISVETFPNLKELDMRNCSNLESLGSTAATSTTTTRTSDPLISPSLTSLHIERCFKLVSFPKGGLYAPNLKSMITEECRNLKSLPQGMRSLLPSLEKLRMRHCSQIESLPEEGLPSSLSSLHIYGCPLLKQRCDREIGEDWPKINHIPELDIS